MMPYRLTVSIVMVYGLFAIGPVAGARWSPFDETERTTSGKSVSAGRTAQAFVGSGKLVDIRAASVSDRRMTELAAFVVDIEEVTLDGQESAGTFGVHLVIDQMSGNVVGFCTTARTDTVRGGNDVSGAQLREHLWNSGRFAAPVGAPKSSFSDILVTAWSCGVPIVRAPALIGRLMIRQSVVRSQRTDEIKSSTESVWLVSRVGFPAGRLEVPGTSQTHALILDGGGQLCMGSLLSKNGQF